MQSVQAFPIAIIDEDYEGKNAAGRGMQPACCRDRERRASASSPASATRTRGGSSRSSTTNPAGWSRSTAPKHAETRWQVLEEVLAAKRKRNDRLPIFLFGDERTAEMVPASVLKHANAFMRLFEDSPEFLARAIVRAAQLYLERLAAADVQGADGLHAAGQLLLAHARPRRRRRLPQEPGRPDVLRVLRREHAALRRLGVGRQARLAARPHRARSRRASATRRASSAPDETLFVVGGTSTANKIVWHGTVGRGDLVLCDRNCHKSILHSLIMTGATPIYLVPSRNGLGIIGPISQRPVHARSRSRRRSPPARSPRRPAARSA